MWAALGNLLKKKAKKTAVNAAKGDKSSQKKLYIGIFGAICIFLLPIFFMTVIMFGPIMLARQYISDFASNTTAFFDKVNNVLSLKGWCTDKDGSCEALAEQKFYEELNNVNEKYNKKNVEIDADLITATIFYGRGNSSYLYETDENGHNQTFIKYFCDAHLIGWAGEKTCEFFAEENYDKLYQENYEKYLKIATNYEELKLSNCNVKNRIIDPITIKGDIEIPITPNNVLDLTKKEACEFFLWNFADLSQVVMDNDIDQITYREGKKDISTLAAEMVSGNSLSYDKYRNYLIKKYIPKRFSNMYINATDKDKEIEKIADEIMLFASKNPQYANIGSSCVTYKCNTVFLTGDYAGEYTLEDYVKGVVYAESGLFKNYVDNYQEEWKAQAIVARSMVLNGYDICNESVPNTPNFQVFKKGWSEEISDAVDETAGIVLTADGNIFSAQYDAFFEGNDSNYYCDSELCYSNYYKKGTGNNKNAWEKQTINTYAKFATHFAPYPNGHGIGMSQWGAAYLADTGKKYDEILSYYYADNITLSKVGNSCSYNADISGYDWRQNDPRWGSKSYGNTTLGKVGCNFTSIVIQIARSNKPIHIEDFNPGTAFDYMKKRGYLGKNGSTLNYAAFSEMAEGFNYVGSISTAGYSKEKIRSTLAQLIDNNKYPIIHVKSGNNKPYSTTNHWVAVVGYTEDDIEIVDPASTGCTRAFSCKPGLDQTNGYGIIDRIEYWE